MDLLIFRFANLIYVHVKSQNNITSLCSLQTPVKEPNSENVDISSGGGVTGWKSKCCS